jgi:glycosyltransferase involved in cell wall biosynthesis
MVHSLREVGTDAGIAATSADGRDSLNVEHGMWVDFRGVPAIFFRRDWSESFKYSGALAAWLRSHVKEFDAVHIHAVFSHSSLAASTAARAANVPYIVRPLGSLDPWSMRQKWPLKALLWRGACRSMLTHASAVHYTSTQEQDLAESSLNLRRGVVIPLGVNSEFSEWQATPADMDRQRKQDPYVLFLGRLHPKKGLELLIPAFARATEDAARSNWQLILAGDGDPAYVARLRLLASEAGTERITFAGWVNGDTKRSLLSNAWLVALTSYQENFGLSVAEAMASGVPVLVSEHVNLATEIRRAGAGWVSRLEIGALAEILDGALDEEARADKASAAAEFAKQYRWPAIAQRLLELYAQVIHQSSGHRGAPPEAPPPAHPVVSENA